jgi:hypothetical protein
MHGDVTSCLMFYFLLPPPFVTAASCARLLPLLPSAVRLFPPLPLGGGGGVLGMALGGAAVLVTNFRGKFPQRPP